MKSTIIVFSTFILTLIACGQQKKERGNSKNTFPESEKLVKSEAMWKQQLTEGEYYILRKKGTERAFTSKLLKNKEEGMYVCKACALPLFHSSTKFKSGTGWPSFYEPINKINVAEAADRSYGMVRTEVLCARCDGHLGHVFPDGPAPTGLRYCINGVSLAFQEQED